MPDLIYLFNNHAFINLPSGLAGWMGWFSLLGLELFFLWRWQKYNLFWNDRRKSALVVFIILVPITSLLIPGIRLHISDALLPQFQAIEMAEPVIMIFAAVPWFLAAGMLGPAAAGGLASLSGLFLAFLSTHDLFLPLEMALLGTLLGAILQQRYRTITFRALSHPLVASLLLIPVSMVLFIFTSALSAEGVLASRLDFALAHFFSNAVVAAIVFFTAGIFAQIIRLGGIKSWGNDEPLVPSPVESSLASRFTYRVIPLALLLAVILIIADWIVAGRVARHMIEGRMSAAAQMAAESVPFILITGQNLVAQLTEDANIIDTGGELILELEDEDLRVVPYFNQLVLVDAQAQLITSVPEAEKELALSPEELSAVDLITSQEVLNQFYIVPPSNNSLSAMISFMAPVMSGQGPVQGVLIGRSDLAANPFSQPVLKSLESLSEMDGTGMLVDENGLILYHPDPDMLMQRYPGPLDKVGAIYDGIAENGTRQLVYHQAIMGRPWGVVITVPARYIQQQALVIAGPILAIISLLVIAVMIFVPLGFRSITASLNNLAVEANQIASGNLDRPLIIDREDEIGQLRQAFEQMRVRLKTRLDELGQLFKVSQGVASSLEIENSLRPVLEAALRSGSSAVRVVLSPSAVPDLEGEPPTMKGFGTGPLSELYRNLDEQILSLARQRDQLKLTNLTRPRLFGFSPGFPRPQAILAMALRREKQFYGALWLAYDHPHQFSTEEVNFFATLAGQAAMAVANASLFQTAEVGRRRLEAILASTPDPVFVTDHRNYLLIWNPAACHALGFELEKGAGKPIEEVIPQKELVRLLRDIDPQDQTVELVMPDERVYSATASTVVAEGRSVGRVCVLSDITQFKKLDTLKSEFVSTVSHDLRSPLTLIRGYATMLQMVGELNEQQTGHIRKIVTGVENMSRLVNNLLDLSRIEAGIGLQLEVLPVHDLVERVIGGLHLQAAQKRLNLEVEIPKNMNPALEADHALLQQALHNLVENAINYTDAGGQVAVKLRTQQDQMIFEVHDTGTGIAPADQQRLFEKFYRTSRKGAKEDRGSGLGLAIVKSIAELHHGKVWAKSQLGKGSTFFLSIPIRQEEGETENMK